MNIQFGKKFEDICCHLILFGLRVRGKVKNSFCQEKKIKKITQQWRDIKQNNLKIKIFHKNCCDVFIKNNLPTRHFEKMQREKERKIVKCY